MPNDQPKNQSSTQVQQCSKLTDVFDRLDRNVDHAPLEASGDPEPLSISRRHPTMTRRPLDD